MSGIFDQIINYSPPLIVSGTVNYKGTWNASTNNPTLNSSPAASTKGDYYVVSTAGTQFGITFAIGDWIISNGTAWEKVDLTDAVSSVFGRTGAVVGVSTDYSAVGLTNTAIGAANPSTGAFTTVTASSTIAATGAVTGSNLSGTNTGDQTTITGNAGSATVLQTPRAIYGNNFDGSAALTQVIASTYGGTGNGFTKFSGPASSEKTFTLPNASSTLLYEGGALGTPSSGTVTNLTGTASININGTVGATTPSTGQFTTGGFNGVSVFGGTTDRDFGTGVFSTFSAPSLQFMSQTDGSTYKNYSGFGMNFTSGDFGFINNYQYTGGGKFGIYLGDLTSTSGALTRVAYFTSTGLNSTAIGATTASTGAFTTLSATGAISSSGSQSNNIGAGGTGTGISQFVLNGGSGTNGGSNIAFNKNSVGKAIVGIDSCITGGTSDNLMNYVASGGTIRNYIGGTGDIGIFSSTGLAVSANNGSISLTRASGSFGLRIKQDNTLGEIAFQTKLSDDTTWQSYIKVGEGNSSANSHLILQPTAGNVGIGVTPSAWDATLKAITVDGTAVFSGQANAEVVRLGSNWYYNAGFKYQTTGSATIYDQASGKHSWYTAASGTAGNAISFAERMTLDSSGNLLVGTTSADPSGSGSSGRVVVSTANGGQAALTAYNAGTGAVNIISIENGNGQVGRIQCSGSTTLFLGTSDKRLKENVKPITDSSDIIDRLAPKKFDWKTGGKNAYGFIAQEAIEVFPEAVSAGDSEDEIKSPWAMDYSKLVPILVAELQSVRQRLAALEA